MARDQDNNDADRTHSVGDQPSPLGDLGLQRLGEFEIRSSIGVGGMGAVYLAHDESMKRDVALKVLHPSLEISKSSQIRFAREAWIAGQLEHRNIIRVFSRGEEDRYNYIAMELADGGSLSSHIDSTRDTIKPDDTASVTATSDYQNWLLQRFVGLAEGLEHIHSKGFIHRDIKPHNILLSGENKQFKLTDFGIAHAQDMTRMTKAGDFIGTIKYMSPELLTAHRAKVDKRTDIYSLGVSLYEALTMKLPFEADTDEGFISEILSGHAIPARRRNKKIPHDLETVLLKAVHHDPDRRYQTAAEFAEDLKRVLNSQPIRAKREGLAARTLKYVVRNKRVALATVVTAVLFAIVTIQYNSWKQQEMDKERILRTLKMVYESHLSAFEVDPDWPRLSKILHDHLRSGSVDSMSIWFYRINSLYTFDSPDYCLLENGNLFVRPHHVQTLSKPDYWPNNFVASMSTVETSGDGADYKEIAGFYLGYGSERNTDLSISENFESILGDVSGQITFTVRVITKHYLNATFYDRIEFVRNYPEFEQLERKISAEGDTLVCVGLELGGCGGTAYLARVLSDEDELPAAPVYIDTTIDSFAVLVFEAYPKGFPKQVVDESGRFQQERAMAFDRIRLVKSDRKTDAYDTRFADGPEDSLAIPITGDFSILERITSDTLFKGHIQIRYNPGRYCRLGRDGKKGSGRRLESTGHSAEEFEHLISKGPIEARLQITPSIAVARLFGDVDEFWGDTIETDIIFQAFDSSNVED